MFFPPQVLLATRNSQNDNSILKSEGAKLLERVHDIEEEYSNKFEDIELKLESVKEASNTAQNSSPLSRTIHTGKRKIVAKNI